MARGIPTPGTDDLEGLSWGMSQKRERDFFSDIMPRITALQKRGSPFTLEEYGKVSYGPEDNPSAARTYPLLAFKVGNWRDAKKPTVLIMGGVHPYERGGIEGVLHFLENDAERYAKHFNLLVVPVFSPSAYDIESRLNLLKQNVNREFVPDSLCAETNQFIRYLKKLNKKFLMAIDCHETLPEDVVAMNKGNDPKAGVDMEQMPNATYIMEDFLDPKDSMGKKLIQEIRKHVPISQDANVFGFPNSGGVVRGLAAGVAGAKPGTPAEKGLPTTSVGYLLKYGHTKHTLMAEIFATPDMNMETRIEAQRAVLIPALEELLSRQRGTAQKSARQL